MADTVNWSATPAFTASAATETPPAEGAAPAKEEPAAKEAPVEAKTEDQGEQKTEPEPKAEAKPDPDKVIELSRKSRASDEARVKAENDAKEARAEVERLRPLGQLMRLGVSDKIEDRVQFLAEIADVINLTPERAMEIMAAMKAGGDATLTPEDRIAMLERRLAEGKDEPEPEKKDEEPDTEGAEARQGFIDGLNATVKAAPQQYPECAKEPAAADAAFIVMVKHWETHKSDPNYRPLSNDAALAAVERTLSTARRAEDIGQRATGAPASTGGGLSNSMAGPVVPQPQQVLSDREIKAAMMRDFGF